MPIYEYEPLNQGCDYCSKGFEVLHLRGEPETTICPKCHKPVRKVVSRLGRVEVAYTPSDAFKHYMKKLDQQRRLEDKEQREEES